MKNKYIAKILCITLISAMVLGSTVGVFANEYEPEPLIVTSASYESAQAESDVLLDEDCDSDDLPVEPTEPAEPTVTPTPPVVTSTPTVEPAEPTVTPTVEPTIEPTVTPTPKPTEKPTTPKPTVKPEPTVEPTDIPVDEDAVQNVINLISALSGADVTRQAIDDARNAYEALSDEEKSLVTNYGLLIEIERNFVDEPVEDPADDPDPVIDYNPGGDDIPIIGDGTSSGGTTVISNLHAGRSFYLDQLKDTYSLEFDDEFEDVMDSIEKAYKKKNKISKKTEILVRNWQDILAVYVLKQKKAGKKEYKLDKTSKKELAAIFEELNPIVRDKKNILLVSYGDLKVDDYIKEHRSELKKSDRKLLRKYTGNDCALLCSTITAAKGFIRESAGENISEERVNVIAAGYSLVGKVGYFWGGKSHEIGWDSSWGTAATVSAAGSRSSGTTRAFGLDCSGFVTWAFINGYEDEELGASIGEGTSSQWEQCETINAEDAQPGDLVFQRGPEAGSNNHVGILVGQTDDGDWIAVHCSSSQNGVVVGEAYSASFRYIRCPSMYPTIEEVLAEREALKKKAVESAKVLSTDSKDKISIYESIPVENEEVLTVKD